MMTRALKVMGGQAEGGVDDGGCRDDNNVDVDNEYWWDC